MDEILRKYSNLVLKNIDKDNFFKIYNFLIQNNCNYIDDIIEDYLDLFTINYEEFKKKFEILNIKYNNQFLKLANEDMDILEEFYY